MSRRIVQLNAIVHKTIAEFIEKNYVPANGIISISYVSLSADISQAEVGVTLYPNNPAEYTSVIKDLNRNKSELQLLLARQHKLKNIPVITYKPDSNQHKVDEIENLLDRVSRERR